MSDCIRLAAAPRESSWNLAPGVRPSMNNLVHSEGTRVYKCAHPGFKTEIPD